MKKILVIAIPFIAVVASTAQSAPALLDIVDVAAPAINCIFDLDCTITVTDTSDHFTLGGTVGDAFLQSRTFPPGEPGTAAEGLYGYEYRIDLRHLIGILHVPCITSFSIETGPVVPLDYDENGDLDDVFVVTSGGLGTVAPATADQVGDTITFEYAPPVCAGGSPGDGESTFFFGFTSAVPPRDVVAQVRDTSETTYTLDARAPSSAQRVDHFQCYETLGKPVRETVFLRDQFGEERARVLEPIQFCNPVEKTHDSIVTPIQNRAAHLKFYQIETPEQAPERQVVVSNQFGAEQKLEVKEPVFLAVPTRKLWLRLPEPWLQPEELSAQSPELWPESSQWWPRPLEGLDHFKCYEARGESVDTRVTLKDQFRGKPPVRVRHPALLCNPVEKTHDSIVTPIQNPEDHLVCYDIRGTSARGIGITRNQFGAEILRVGRADLLCVPSRKKVGTEPVPGEVTNDITAVTAPLAVPPPFQGCRSPTPDFVVTGSETVVSGDEHCFPNTGVAFGPKSDIFRLTKVDGMDVADMDGDGDNDFLVCDGVAGEVYLYTQGPPGLFTPSVVATGVTSGIGGSQFCTYLREGDLNEDGQKDFVVGDNRVTNGMFVYLQGPPGTFTPVSSGLDVSWASPSGAQCNCLFGLAVGDEDGDGHQDVLVLGYRGTGAGQVWFYQGNGAGGMAAPILKFDVSADFPVVDAPTGLALFDVDADADLDVIVGGAGDGSHYIYTNDGFGNFTAPAAPAFDVDNYTGIDAYDFNGDNRDDLMLVDWTTRQLFSVENVGGGLAAPVIENNVDGNSIGIGAPPPTVSQPVNLDHFKCYPTQEGEPLNVPVFLRDQFGDREAWVLEPARFCNPVAKNHNGVVTPIRDRDAHLAFYRMQTETRVPPLQVSVSNQFGDEQTLQVRQPLFLAVPTHKLVPGSHRPPRGLDHFECYEASGEPVASTALALRDQFGLESGLTLHTPVALCNPVEKTHDDFVTPIQNPDDHLVCYKLEGTQLTKTAQMRNQFGEEVLSLEPADLLCVPTRKELPHQDPNITQMCGDNDAVDFDGGMVLPGDSGTGLLRENPNAAWPDGRPRRPCGQYVPVDGFLPSSGVKRFRVAYREHTDPVPPLGTAPGIHTKWILRDRSASPFCQVNAANVLETVGPLAWMDAADYLDAKFGGIGTDWCPNSGLRLAVWDSSNHMGLGPADPDGHYVLWLEWEDNGSVLHKEPFEHHLQLDNTLPVINDLLVTLEDGTTAVGACGEAPEGEHVFKVYGDFADDYYWSYSIRVRGGDPPTSRRYPRPNPIEDPDSNQWHDYYEGTPQVANTDKTGTTPAATTVFLRDIDMNDFGASFTDCCYLLEMFVRDAAIRHSFNNRVANNSTGGFWTAVSRFITFSAAP